MRKTILEVVVGSTVHGTAKVEQWMLTTYLAHWIRERREDANLEVAVEG